MMPFTLYRQFYVIAWGNLLQEVSANGVILFLYFAIFIHVFLLHLYSLVCLFAREEAYIYNHCNRNNYYFCKLIWPPLKLILNSISFYLGCSIHNSLVKTFYLLFTCTNYLELSVSTARLVKYRLSLRKWRDSYLITIKIGCSFTEWPWACILLLLFSWGTKGFFGQLKAGLQKMVMWWRSLFMYIIKITRWLFKDSSTTLLTVPQWDFVIILWLNTCRQAYMLRCKFLAARYFLKGIIHNRVYDWNKLWQTVYGVRMWQLK